MSISDYTDGDASVTLDHVWQRDGRCGWGQPPEPRNRGGNFPDKRRRHQHIFEAVAAAQAEVTPSPPAKQN